MRPKDRLDKLLGKVGLSKVIRIGAWLLRFKSNSRVKKHERMAVPVTTQEIQYQHLFWTERVQMIQSQEEQDDERSKGS